MSFMRRRNAAANRRSEMKVCPIAIVAGCPKCPVFRICPAKELLGGYEKPPEVKAKPAARKPRAAAKKKA
jgi:hypothetical protein